MKKIQLLKKLSFTLFFSLLCSVCFSKAMQLDELYAASTGFNSPGRIFEYLIDTSKNIPPIVIINSPTDSATYTTDEKIKLNVSATDLDGTISKVEFYNGTNLLNTDSIFPYEYLWSDFRVGDYSIIAKATDNGGSVTAAAINISVVHGEIPTVEDPLFAYWYWDSGSTVILWVVVADDDGEENLTYTWSVIGIPPAPVTFEDNGSFAFATVQKAGTYSFLVTIKDRTNHTVTSSATITILRDVSDCNSIVDILPHNITVTVNSQVQFYNVSVDQFDDLDTTMGTPNFRGSLFGYGTYLWKSTTGPDRIDKYSGIYSAPGTPGKDTVFMEAWHIGYVDSSYDRFICKTLHYSVITIVDSKPPTVKITSPVEGASYTALATIILSADASDEDGKVKTVSFYNGDKLIFTEDYPPFYRNWYHVPVGDYSITAVATDDSGLVTTSAPVHISVVPNKPPTVKITSPVEGASYTALATIILSADASDVDGKVKTVSFYNGNTLIFTEDYPPFSRKWLHVPVGNYSITAKATDDKGKVTTSDAVNISVVPDIPPMVKITSPANGTSFTSPATIRLSAEASDIDGTIRTVDFYNGNTLLFTEKLLPYSREWFDVSGGNYSITAKATDNNGKTTTSAPIVISVAAASKSIASGGKLNLSNKPLGLNVNPNPVANTLNISIDGLQTNSRSAISLISVSGVVIKTIQSNTLDKNVQLDVSSLSAGVYFIKLTNGDKVLYKQFVKL